MWSIYEFHNKLRKATLQPGYTNWLEDFIRAKGKITDNVEDEFFTSQSNEDMFNLSLLSAFSSLVMEYAERTGFKTFNIKKDVIYWGTQIALSNKTSVLVQIVDEETNCYTVIHLLDSTQNSFTLEDVKDVFLKLI